MVEPGEILEADAEVWMNKPTQMVIFHSKTACSLRKVSKYAAKKHWGYQIVRQTCLGEETHNKEETQPFFRDLMRRYSTKSGI